MTSEAISTSSEKCKWAAPLELQGDSYTIGWQHGNFLKQSIRSFLDDGLYRINQILQVPTSLNELTGQIEAYAEALHRYTPALLKETEGLADGAGISRNEAILLQIRREVIGYSRTRTNGDCTTFARTGPKPVLGQTIDLNGNMQDQLSILHIRHAGRTRRVLLLSFSGLVGYLGMNEAGLAIGLNLVLGGPWEPGVPPYLVIRHLLDTASSAQECLEILREMKIAGSRSFTICDGERILTVEILANEIKVVESRKSIHTNHYLDPVFASQDQLNIFARNSSVQRLNACEAGLGAIPVEAPPQAYFDMLSQEPIYVAGSDNIRKESTVASVVLLPRDGVMWVQGNKQYGECQFQYQV